MLRFILSIAVIILPTFAHALPIAPEPASGFTPKEAVTGKEYMVVSARPEASKAGAEILEAGGNAIDAAIAVQMALNVTEPQASGIGGGGFLLYYDAKTGKVTAYDGRETAPKHANSTMFLDKNGEPKEFFDAVKGGLSVGTPGVLKMLDMAHREHGHLPWNKLFQPAIRVATKGFPITERFYITAKESPYLKEFPEAAALYMTPDGEVKPVGTIITNPELANTLNLIANEGITPFYEGALAEKIVKTVQGSGVNPGYLSLEDLKKYEAKERPALCVSYRVYTVCTMPPPTSGGLTVVEALKLLERFKLPLLKPDALESVHLITEAMRIAFADRNAYVADPDFVTVPMKAMLDKNYICKRSDAMEVAKTMPTPLPGVFGPKPSPFEGKDEPPSTTHMSIVDKEGNAVSYTSSIENAFGSALTVDGFLLNNQLTDFSFLPEVDGKPVANRVQPGKRPRSSMAPVMVFNKEHQLVLVAGSPGGVRIIPFVLQTLVAILDWDLPVQEALDLPHHASVSETLELEKGTSITALQPKLEQLGYMVAVTDLTSGLHVIAVNGKMLTGAADPRRDGVAVGK